MEKISDYLRRSVDDKNITGIRSVFTTIAGKDPSFSTGEFEDSLNYVRSKNIPGLFVPFDGEQFPPREQWDKEHRAMMIASLMDNFCMERINHLKQVSCFLYPPQANEPQMGNHSTHSHPHTGYSDRRGGGNPPKKAVPAAVTVGLAVTCLATAAAGAKIVAVTFGVAATVTGIYTIIKQ